MAKQKTEAVVFPIVITREMLLPGVEAMRESGALAVPGSGDALLVLRIVEAVLGAQSGEQRSSIEHNSAKKIAIELGRYL